MFKKIAFTFGIKVIIAILNLAIVVLLSRNIGAEGKGEASLIVTSIAMILLFCNIVGGSSLVYFVPRHNIFRLFLLSNAWSLIVCIIAFLLFQVFPFVPESAIIPVILLSLINSFLSTNLNILLGAEKINTHNVISLLQAIINMIILLLMLKGMDQYNVGSYIISLYSAMGGCLLISCFLVYPVIASNKQANEDGLAIKLFQYGAYGQAGHVMKFMSFRCTYYMLSAYSGEVTLGIFSNGVSVIESIFLISNSIATILYPKISNSKDDAYSRLLTLQLTKLSIILCITALVPLMLLPSSFYIWLFGPEFSGVQNVIIILAPGVLFYNIALVIGHYFSGRGFFKVNTWANLTGLITTLALALLWYPQFGMTEVGIISTVSYIATGLFIIFHFMKDAGIPFSHMLPRPSDVKFLLKEAKGLLKKE
jgi:O-antigen/teichoic acid export membrane protein